MSNSLRISQNFLHSPRLVGRLLGKTNIGSEDTVLDIGAGKGILTTALAPACARVIAIEPDHALAEKLRKNTAEYGNVKLFEGDFLGMRLPGEPYKVFANIPFSRSADILHKLIDSPKPPEACYLIAQKQFAQKLLVKPGGYNSQLAILMSVQFKVRIVETLRPENFYPVPKVPIVFLEILKRKNPLVAAAHMQLFRDFIVHTYNAFKPSVAEALSPLFTAGQFEQLAAANSFRAKATPTQLNTQQWLALFAAALTKRSALEHLVDGAERAQLHMHAGRQSRHRTR